jgi:uncharacterized protein
MTDSTDLTRNDFSFVIRRKLQARISRLSSKFSLRKFDPEDFKTEQQKIVIPHLAPAFHGYKIVHISDIHYGQWISADRLRGVVGLINQIDPDIVAVTGDFVSYLLNDKMAEDMVEQLGELKPKDAAVAVLGNHDHWAGAERVRDILRKSNILDISNSIFEASKPNSKLIIAGVDSVMLKKDRLDLVLEKMPADAPAILLVHEPDFATTSAATKRFSLQLSGHSHGGQFVIPKLGTPIRGNQFMKYPLGMYKVEGMTLYTNRGLGTNSHWLRINCPPEITVITLL